MGISLIKVEFEFEFFVFEWIKVFVLEGVVIFMLLLFWIERIFFVVKFLSFFYKIIKYYEFFIFNKCICILVYCVKYICKFKSCYNVKLRYFIL